MRLVNQDDDVQVLDAFLLLTQEELGCLISFLESCLESVPGPDSHMHIFGSTDEKGERYRIANGIIQICPGNDVTREIMATCYSPYNTRLHGWHARTLGLMNDLAGDLVDYSEPERQP